MQFRGDDEEGLTGENELAKQIAAAGNKWSSENWRKEDMVSRLFTPVRPHLTQPQIAR